MDSLRKQLKSQTKKAKIGWACYYQERDNHLRNIQELHSKIISMKNELEQKQKTENQDVFPIFVQNEIRELYDMVNKELECPICLDTIKKDELVFSNCGHKYCESCLSKLDKCGVCRKTIYRK